MTKKKAFVKCKFCSADARGATEKEVVVDKAGLIQDPKDGVYILRFSVRALCPVCWGQTEAVFRCHFRVEELAEMALDEGGCFQEDAYQ